MTTTLKSSHRNQKEKNQPPNQMGKLLSVQLLKKDFLLGFFLFVGMLAVYQPAWNGTPIWDDDSHITRPDLRSFDGLSRIWTQLGATQQYYPLVHSIFWLEYHLWSDSTPGYHLVNILLHVLSALLLVLILRRLAIPGTWLIAAIFALHPVQAESIAWISELKNTLSGVFYLSALLTYLHFDKVKKRKPYIIAFALFILGLLSKSVIATLPISLLIIFWWKRGKIDLAAIGHLDEAIAHYRKALEIKPIFAEAWNNLGDALLQVGQADEAMLNFKRALEYNPEYAEAHYNLGNILLKYRQINEAIEQFTKALEINPNYEKAHNNLGNALFVLGQIDAAVYHYQKVLEINPNKINTLQNLADALARKGQIADAISVLQKALQLAKSTGQKSLVSEIATELEKLSNKR